VPPPPFPVGPTGFAAARQAARRAWLILAAVALTSGWRIVEIIPGFFTVGAAPPLSDGAPNIWSIVQALPWIGDLPLAGLALATAAGAAAWLAACFSVHPPRGDRLLPAIVLVALVLPGLLPHMQPRDFLPAVALSGMLAVRQRKPAIAMLVMAGWSSAMAGVPILGAVPIIVAILSMARRFLVSPANDNGLPLNPHRAYPA